MKQILAACVLLALPGAAWAEAKEGAGAGVKARLVLATRHVPLNQPVWAHFSVENISGEPVTLTVPGTEPELPNPEVGLPLSHIFSGSGSGTTGVKLTTQSGQAWTEPVGYRKPAKAPIMLLAPRSSVGAVVDLREYFPTLRGAGTYKVVWEPYSGAGQDSATFTIAPRKQVELVTDEGKLTMRLFYDEAPNHVENFLELAKINFYSGLTLHRVEPGYLIQGGCPRGDGTGIRLDGKRIPAEPNELKHQKGSVSMALLGDDPDSASCQFFISNTRMREWDSLYTVFAELVGEESFATLDRLMASPVDAQGRPQKTLVIRSMQLVDERPAS